MNVIILNLKFVRIDIRPWEPVQPRIFHIHDAPAVEANQVMMLADLGIEPGSRPRVTGLRDQPQRDERAEDAMDRHTRNLRQFPPNLAVKLLSRRMVDAVQDRFKHDAALGCHRQSAFAMGGEKAIHSFLVVRHAHCLADAYFF